MRCKKKQWRKKDKTSQKISKILIAIDGFQPSIRAEHIRP
jgi:hypothetical protein